MMSCRTALHHSLTLKVASAMVYAERGYRFGSIKPQPTRAFLDWRNQPGP